jgi:hypothetical protein
VIGDTDAKHQPGVTKGKVPHGSATITKMLKGKLMKKYAMILLTAASLLGFGVAAKAETRAEIFVKLPFQFLVGGKTLPAGTYKVSRFSGDPFGALMLTNYDNTAAVFVLPSSIADASSDKPQVDFKQVGGRYVLSSIQTEDFVYNISIRRSLAMVAADKPHDTTSVSGSAGVS